MTVIHDSSDLNPISVERAIEIAREFIPRKYILKFCADMESEYWFSYISKTGEDIIGVSLIGVPNNVAGLIHPISFTQKKAFGKNGTLRIRLSSTPQTRK